MSVFPDKLYELGGKPVGGGLGAMWPAETTWFVDYDNGHPDTNGGKKTNDAFKYLDSAISCAAHGDVIYIRPRSPELGAAGAGPYYGGDPGDITPQTAATNWTIAYTKYGLSLIGTGNGRGSAGASQTCLQGGTTTSTPVLTINAPYVTLENLGIKPGSSTTGLVKQSFTNDAADQAWANTYYNIWFRNVDAQAGYSLAIDSGTYDNIVKCNFSGHPTGILFWSTNDACKAEVINDCDFEVATGSVKCNIQTIGSVSRILWHNLRMNHVLPSGGSPNLYVSVGATSTGVLSHVWTGAVADTLSTNMTLNGILGIQIYNQQVGLMV